MYIYIYNYTYIYICIIKIFEVNKISFILQRDFFPCGSPQGVHIRGPHLGTPSWRHQKQNVLAGLCFLAVRCSPPGVKKKASMLGLKLNIYIYT